MNPILSVAQKTVLHAGKNLSYFAKQILQLSPNQRLEPSLLLELNRKIETEIVNALSQIYSDHYISGSDIHHGSTESSHHWIINAIDGKDNFLRGLPHYAITVTYLLNNKPQLAVVYNPETEMLFTASKGEGATQNGRRIRIEKHSGKLNEAIIATVFPHKKERVREQYLQQFNQLLFQTKDIRRFGATSLDLCFVANNYVNAYWTLNMNVKQFMAGAFIINEAGGLVADLNGSNEWQDSTSVVACNPRLLKPLLQFFASSQLSNEN